jgi:hypothetical protein
MSDVGRTDGLLESMGYIGNLAFWLAAGIGFMGRRKKIDAFILWCFFFSKDVLRFVDS